MKVLLTGATGFTGSHVIPRLLAGGARVRCLVRPGRDVKGMPADRVDIFYGDLDDPRSLAAAMESTDTLVNIASLGFGHAPGIVDAAVATGVRRAVFISTTAIFTTLPAPSRKVRLAAEECVQSSGLAFTILRPTMIYGTPRDRNICRLIRYLDRYPVIPVVGRGEHLQQPVHVEDVADAVAGCLAAGRAVGRAYNISGASPLTFNRLLDIVIGMIGKKRWKIHLPVAPVVGMLRAVERLARRAPIKAEQVLRLNEDKAFDFSEAARDFGYSPRTFEQGVRDEVESVLGRPARR